MWMHHTCNNNPLQKDLGPRVNWSSINAPQSQYTLKLICVVSTIESMEIWDLPIHMGSWGSQVRYGCLHDTTFWR